MLGQPRLFLCSYRGSSEQKMGRNSLGGWVALIRSAEGKFFKVERTLANSIGGDRPGAIIGRGEYSGRPRACPHASRTNFIDT